MPYFQAYRHTKVISIRFDRYIGPYYLHPACTCDLMHYRMSLYLKWAIGFARVPNMPLFAGGDLNTPSNTRHLDWFSRVCSALNCKPHIANLITNELRPVTDTSVRNKRRQTSRMVIICIRSFITFIVRFSIELVRHIHTGRR